MAGDWVDATEAEIFPADDWEDVSEKNVWVDIEPRGRIAELGTATARGFLTLGEAAVGAVEKVTPLLKKTPGFGLPMRGIERLTGKSFEEEQAVVQENIAAAAEKLPRTRAGLGGWALNVIGEGAPYLASTVASGGYSLAYPFMIGFAVGGESAYKGAIAEGASERQALLEYGLGGLAEAALEMYGVSKILKFKEAGKASLKGLARNLRGKLWKQAVGDLRNITGNALKSALVESLEEASQEGASLIIPAALRGSVPRRADGSVAWGSMVKQIGEAAAGGGLLGFLVPGGMNVPHGLAEMAAPSVENIQTAAKRIRESNLGDVEKARYLAELEEITGETQDIPESTRRRLEIAKKFETELIEYEAKRPELRKEMKEAIHKKFGKIEEVRKDLETKDPIIASRIARKAAEGYARSMLTEFQEKFSRDEITELAQSIRESNLPTGDYLTLSRFFEDLLADVQPHKSGIKMFDKFFGTNILEKGFRKRPLTKTQKLLQIAREPFNLLKAMVCSCDFSAGGIQALMVAPNHPKIWGQGVGKGYRAFFSSEYTQLAELEMKTDPRYNLIQKYGPKLITEIGGGIKGEELFVSELAHRIPGIGKMVQASDRAFVTTLNNIRSNLFYQWCEQHGVSDTIIPQNISIAEIKEVLNHIGNLTGRALGKPGGKFEKYAPELGAIFWSPRLYLATARSMTDWATKSHIRKEAAADLLQAFGIGMLILALADLIPDVTVEFDPRSSDFAKIRKDNARITFFGQHTQMMRVVAQMVLQQKKATATGRIYHKDWLDTALRFMRGKLSPTATIPIDVATGTTFLGKKMRWEPEFMEEYVVEKIAPMFLQDVADAVRYQGVGTALWTSPLAIHGIGAQIYEPTAGSESARIKNHYAHQMYGVDWDELGPMVQKAIKLTRPAIEAQERKARMERENFDFAKEMFEEQNEAARRVYKSLPKDVQKEFDRVGAEVKDLSRRIGSNWYLNQGRYKQYEEGLKKLLKRVVVPQVRMSGWNKLDENTQREILNALVDQCRKHVRQQIILTANIEDVMRK